MYVNSETDLVIVSSHYNENLDWLHASPYPVIISSNHPTFKLAYGPPDSKVFFDEELRAPANIGREASAYLRFIVKYYDALPKHIAFIHGHETAWHQRYPGTLLDAISEAKYREFPFISINNMHSAPDLLRVSNKYWSVVHAVWPHHFLKYVGTNIPLSICRLDCCAQFIVSREKILKYPKHVWEHWLKITQVPGHVNSETFELMPWLFEYTWHIIFGEPIEYPFTEKEYLAHYFDTSFRSKLRV